MRQTRTWLRLLRAFSFELLLIRFMRMHRCRWPTGADRYVPPPCPHIDEWRGTYVLVRNDCSVLGRSISVKRATAALWTRLARQSASETDERRSATPCVWTMKKTGQPRVGQAGSTLRMARRAFGSDKVPSAHAGRQAVDGRSAYCQPERASARLKHCAASRRSSQRSPATRTSRKPHSARSRSASTW